MHYSVKLFITNMIWDFDWIFLSLVEIPPMVFLLLDRLVKSLVVEGKDPFFAGDGLKTNFVDYSVGDNVSSLILTKKCLH